MSAYNSTLSFCLPKNSVTLTFNNKIVRNILVNLPVPQSYQYSIHLLCPVQQQKSSKVNQIEPGENSFLKINENLFMIIKKLVDSQTCKMAQLNQRKFFKKTSQQVRLMP